jgi:opacity protein-like surface antigen
MCIEPGTKKRKKRRIPKSSMKKYAFNFFIVCLCSSTALAQALEQGDETVTPYYGPTVFKDLYNPYSNFMNQGATSNYKKIDKGTFGISYEYMVNDVIGLGGDISYHRSETSWTETFDKYNPVTGMYSNPSYNYKIVAPTIAVLGRMNIHYSYAYSMFSDEFDTYLIIGIGYKKTNYKVTTNDLDYVLKVSPPLFTVSNSSTPIGGKIGAGFRYFPTENLAITMETVAGQPFLAFGLTFRY